MRTRELGSQNLSPQKEIRFQIFPKPSPITKMESKSRLGKTATARPTAEISCVRVG